MLERLEVTGLGIIDELSPRSGLGLYGADRRNRCGQVSARRVAQAPLRTAGPARPGAQWRGSDCSVVASFKVPRPVHRSRPDLPSSVSSWTRALIIRREVSRGGAGAVLGQRHGGHCRHAAGDGRRPHGHPWPARAARARRATQPASVGGRIRRVHEALQTESVAEAYAAVARGRVRA